MSNAALAISLLSPAYASAQPLGQPQPGTARQHPPPPHHPPPSTHAHSAALRTVPRAAAAPAAYAVRAASSSVNAPNARYAAPLQRNFAHAQEYSRLDECDKLASQIDNLLRASTSGAPAAPLSLRAPGAAYDPTPGVIPAAPVYLPPPSRPLPKQQGRTPPNLPPAYPSALHHAPTAVPMTEKDKKQQRERGDRHSALEARYRQLNCRP
ncbi:hypothetical protein [Burkholderia sp. TSV86]|uniref:hypothetical protein n=1 Tax=Burkholderia sp. TSV86 TaxID=1385594 RepID=UPI0012E33D98|nr:hypothetical protein [Burkholderia sp. TSV86]